MLSAGRKRKQAEPENATAVAGGGGGGVDIRTAFAGVKKISKSATIGNVEGGAGASTDTTGNGADVGGGGAGAGVGAVGAGAGAISDTTTTGSGASVEGAGAGASSATNTEALAILNLLGLPSTHPSIAEVFLTEVKKPYFISLWTKLQQARASRVIFPPAGRELASISLIAGGLSNVRVVILGQDPYHGPGQAHGLSFSVPVGIDIPPSLRNILKEVNSGTKAAHGNLEAWTRQNVLLLNTVLTVESGKANSHANILGWERLTDIIISTVSRLSPHCVFMLWGANAQSKKKLIDKKQHLVLEAPHPSPLSSYRGFFGCAHFIKANDFLKTHGLPEIDWKL